MKNTINKYLIILLLTFIIIFTGFQVVRFFNKPYKSDTVIEYTVCDSVQTSGIIFRDEIIINTPSEPNTRYMYKNATRISKNDVIAEIYTSKRDIINIQKSESIKKEMDMLTNVLSYKSKEVKPTNIVSEEINNSLVNILNTAHEGNLKNIQNQKLDIEMNMNKKDIYMGLEKNFDTRIQELTNEVSSIKQKTSKPIKEIKADNNGYFVKEIDGYENIYTPEKIENLSVDTLKTYIAKSNKPKENNNIGKIVRDYHWYFTAIVDKNDIEKFTHVTYVDIDFHLSKEGKVPATIYKIIPNNNNDKFVIVFECDYVTDELMQIRKADVDILFKHYRGLRVPQDSIRFYKNIKGVYVLGPYAMEFKPVKIIYEGKDFVLCDGTYAMDGKKLNMYDKIIVEGRGKDGQAIK